MMMSCMRYFHQELIVMAAIRPMSRFISEAPEAFLQNNTPSLKLLAILPYCLASGEGQGAAYMLPALVQLSQFMSATDIKRNFDRSDQPVMYVSHTLKNVIRFGLLNTIRSSHSKLKEYFTLRPSSNDDMICKSTFAEIKRDRSILMTWSDMIMDLAWSCEEDRDGLDDLVRLVLRELDEVKENVKVFEQSETDMAKSKGRKAALKLVADMEEITVMLQSLFYL